MTLCGLFLLPRHLVLCLTFVACDIVASQPTVSECRARRLVFTCIGEPLCPPFCFNRSGLLSHFLCNPPPTALTLTRRPTPFVHRGAVAFNKAAGRP
ncbi:hypothetical protein HYQ46_005009 [Verticillium longisporum]|nr:hypothetical protein HYQ46_005009 [Verticillium longisporum]